MADHPDRVQRGPEDAAERMGAAVGEAIAPAGLEPSAIARVGLGSPGTMDIPAGRLVKPVNLKGWDEFPHPRPGEPATAACR